MYTVEQQSLRHLTRQALRRRQWSGACFVQLRRGGDDWHSTVMRSIRAVSSASSGAVLAL